MKVKLGYMDYMSCRELAYRRMKGWMKKGSTSGPKDTDKRLMIETRATVCEWAFSRLYPGLAGQFAMDASIHGDGGFDYTLPDGRKVDVKSGPPGAKYMVVGNHTLGTCDLYVMSRFNEDRHNLYVEFLGWIESKRVMDVSVAGDIPSWQRPHRVLLLERLRPITELVNAVQA